MEARRERYNVISQFIDLLTEARMGAPFSAQLLVPVCQFVAEATQARSQYAAMVRCLVRGRVEAEVEVPCTVEGLMRWASPPAVADGRPPNSSDEAH